MNEPDDIVQEVSNKFVWKWKYTLVLLLNLGYGILFYYLMNAYQL